MPGRNRSPRRLIALLVAGGSVVAGAVASVAGTSVPGAVVPESPRTVWTKSISAVPTELPLMANWANCADAEVGIALDLAPQTPLSDSAADRKAAELADGRVNRWFLDPLVGRGSTNPAKMAGCGLACALCCLYGVVNYL